MKIVVSSLTDTGKVRPNNEDTFECYEPSDEAGRTATGWLFLVADGMGGHKGGEVASSLAAKTVLSEFCADVSEDKGKVLTTAVDLANQLVRNESLTDSSLTGMGTTCTAMAVHQGSAFFAHVGDSRAYLLREGEMVQITQDHSLVGEMLRSGILSAEDARIHPKRNVITRSLGIQNSVVMDTPFTPLELQVDDLFLLCSDGLTSMVEDAEIADILRTGQPQTACSQLVDMANQRGGKDNITAIVVRIVEVQSTV